MLSRKGKLFPGPRSDYNANSRKISASAPGIGFGDRFIQIGNWRICDIDGRHASICTTNGMTAQIFRDDGTLHPGPRHDFCCNTRPINPKHKNAPMFGDRYIQIGKWRFGDIDGVHASVSGSNSKKYMTPQIYRSDGTLHPNHGTHWGCDGSRSCGKQKPIISIVDIISRKSNEVTTFLQMMKERQYHSDQQEPMNTMLQRKQSVMKINNENEVKQNIIDESKKEAKKTIEAEMKVSEDKLFSRLQSWITSFVKNDESLKGPRGYSGKDGRDGRDGKQGKPGRNGEKGEMGATGAEGRDGKDGRDGRDGKQGKPGRNGEKGQKGATGAAGRDGKDGKKGDKGYDNPRKILAPEIKRALEQRSIKINSITNTTQVTDILKSKARTSSDESTSTCPNLDRVTGNNPEKLEQYKQEFCSPYRKLDLGQDNVANFAMVYVQDDIDPKNKNNRIRKLKNIFKYIVEDACTTPLFTPKDISLQEQVLAMHETENREWVAFVKLDSTSKDGYLQNEVAYCKDLDYVPRTSVNVKVEQATPQYCNNTVCREYVNVCVECYEEEERKKRRKLLTTRLSNTISSSIKLGCNKGCNKWEHKCLKVEEREQQCGTKYTPVDHYHTKQPLEYTIDIVGTTYFPLQFGHKRRRRRLLQGHRADS
eukprot:g8398.t1